MSNDTEQVHFLYKIQRQWGSSKAARFLLHFLEMQIPMVFGALVCYLLGRVIPTSSSLAAVYHPGTFLFMIGDVLYLSLPVLIWMRFRGHSWRYSLEMGAAMLAPGLAIIVLCSLGADTYWPWLIPLASPAGTVGMLLYMLYRRDHFTEPAGHSAHSASSESDPSCH